jgi:hypothetical protein
MIDDRRHHFNDERRRLFGDRSPEIAFVCECEDTDCTASVVLSPAGFDAARLEPPYRLLHALHESPAEP